MQDNSSEMAHTMVPSSTESVGFFTPQNQTMTAQDYPEIMVFALDFDGCTDHPLSRMRLIKHMVEHLVTHSKTNQLIVDLFSLRQTWILDQHNASENAEFHGGQWLSCAILSKEFMTDLRSAVQGEFEKRGLDRALPTIKCHTMMLGDILNNLPHGSTLSKLATEGRPVVKNNTGQWVDLSWDGDTTPYGPQGSLECTDASKLLLTYAHVHALAEKLSDNQSFIYRIVDDNVAILDNLKTIFSKHPHLVPQQCRIQFLPMSSNHHIYPYDAVSGDLPSPMERQFNPRGQCSNPSPFIHGMGPTNIQFAKDVRSIGHQVARRHFEDALFKTSFILKLLKDCAVYAGQDLNQSHSPMPTQSLIETSETLKTDASVATQPDDIPEILSPKPRKAKGPIRFNF